MPSNYTNVNIVCTWLGFKKRAAGSDIRLSEGSDQSPMKSEPDLESGQKEKEGDAV